MSTADFQKMASALDGDKREPLSDLPDVQKVTVLGAGTEAQAIACHCLSEGADVLMFSAYRAELEPLRQAGGISVRGEGPVGNYQIDQEGPSIRLTSELDAAVDHADVIFVTGPVLKQRTYSLVLAGHLRDGQIVVIAPGRSLGAIEMAWNLRVGGNTTSVSIVEPGQLPWWVTKEGNTLHFSAIGPAKCGVLPSGNQRVLSALQNYLPNMVAAPNVIDSGFADASGFIEVAALMLGGPAMAPGGPDLPVGGVPLDEQNTFRNMIGEQHRAVMRAMSAERRAVAARWGVRTIPENKELYELNAGAASGAGSRPVPTQEHANALVRCAVIGSLVPLISAADIAGVEVPTTRAMVATACAALGGDLMNAGRRLNAIGITAGDLEEARRSLNAIAAGEA